MAISRNDIVERNFHITNNNAIDMPISYFFDYMSEGTMRSSPRWICRGDNADVLNGQQIKDPMARRETLELL